MGFNSKGMFRGAADSHGRFQIGIWGSLRSDRAVDPGD